MSKKQFLAFNKAETFISGLVLLVFIAAILGIIVQGRSNTSVQVESPENSTETLVIDESSDLQRAEEYLEEQNSEEYLDTSEIDAALSE